MRMPISCKVASVPQSGGTFQSFRGKTCQPRLFSLFCSFAFNPTSQNLLKRVSDTWVGPTTPIYSMVSFLRGIYVVTGPNIEYNFIGIKLIFVYGSSIVCIFTSIYPQNHLCVGAAYGESGYSHGWLQIYPSEGPTLIEVNFRPKLMQCGKVVLELFLAKSRGPTTTPSQNMWDPFD